MMKQSRKRKTLIFFLAGGCIIVAPFLLMSAFVAVMNADLYGRLIETKTAIGVGRGGTSREAPIVRLILHRLLVDENAVEASIMVVADPGDLPALISQGKTTITAEVRDGTSFQPFGILKEATLDKTSAKAKPGANSFAIQSERFLLPALPSAWGFLLMIWRCDLLFM